VSAAVAKAACWAADFNGDGKTDLVCIQGQSSVDWGISNGAGFVTRRDQLSLASIQVPLGEHCLVGTFRPKKASELLCIAPNGGTIRLSYADPSEVSLPGPSFAPIAAAPAKNCFAVDLTGDHTTDLACSVAGRWLVAISDGGAWGAMQDWGPNGISDNELTRNCLIGEFNGDEKTDILCKAAPGWVRYISTGSGLDALSLVGGPPVSGSVSDNCMLANFTGDGTTAVLCHRPGYGNSCGDQTSDWEDTPVSRFQPDQCKRISPACEEVGDIDKEDDGIVDGRHKMRVRAHCAVYSNSWTYASVGDTNWKQVRELSITTLGPSLLDACVAADVFGEGRSSVICQTIDHRFTRATNQGFPNDLLTTITTPIGGTTRIEYGPAAGFDRSLSLPLLVATASQLDDGNGTISRLDYRYSGGVYLPLLRDFRGFHQVEIVSGVSDDGMQKHRLLTFMQGGIAQDGSEVPTDPYGPMRGLLKSEQVKDSNGILQSTKSFSYQLPTSATPPFFTPLQSFEYSLQSSRLPITAKHVYKYNARGDILQDMYTSATSSEDYLLVRTYDEPPAGWPLSYLGKQIVYKGLTADRTAELQHLEFGYSSTEQCSHPKREALGLSSPELPTAVTWVNTDGTAETAYNSFDMYGNLECSQDPLGRQTFYVYDALHIEPTEIHLPKTGHIIKYKYYDTQSQNIGAAYAKLESLISPSGATTTFKYDVAGRPKEIKDSLGALWTYAYLNFGQPGKQNISLMAGDLIKEDAYFDGLGRIVRTSRTASSGRSLSTDTNYNNAGLISRTSLPYFTADEQTGYVAHKYDFMQRAIEQVNSNGDDDQFCYLPLQQVHLDANRHFEHTTYDFNGQMLSSAIYESDAKSCADALRVIQEQSLAPYSEDKYQFDPSGRLVLWTDPGNSKRSWTFDGLGHLTSVDAPEEGVVHFAYDRVGNLTSKTYPNGTNRTPIFYKYDALNRLTQKTYGQAIKPFSDIDWGFGYDEGVTANRGLLTSVRRHAQVVSRFSYYLPGRLLEEQTTLEGNTYSLHYGYDDIGRISRLSQDGLSGLEFTYSGSALVKMGTGSTAIRFEDYSASERPGRIVYPDGTETEISYCSALNPSCRRPTFQTAHIKSIQNGSVLLDETYAYDGVGNLSKLKGSDFDYTYSYDDADRLVRSHDASLQAGDPSDRSVNYDSRGNITAYDGASYSYKQVVGDRGYVLKQAGARTYDYWGWGAVKSIIENGQKKWRIQYNPEGAPSEVFSPSGRNLLEYDWQGRLLYRSTGPNMGNYIVDSVT
jgi:YD repeat-containing protein